MKKIAFALQVLTLITMLPVYVIVEMNHATVPATENNTVAKITGEVKIFSPVYTPMRGNKMKI